MFNDSGRHQLFQELLDGLGDRRQKSIPGRIREYGDLHRIGRVTDHPPFKAAGHCQEQFIPRLSLSGAGRDDRLPSGDIG